MQRGWKVQKNVKLSKSISKSVEDLINQTLKGVFDSNNFTQVVVDQSKERRSNRV